MKHATLPTPHSSVPRSACPLSSKESVGESALFSDPLTIRERDGVRMFCLFISLLASLFSLFPTLAADTPTTQPETTQPATTQPADAPSPTSPGADPSSPTSGGAEKLANLADKLPGIKVDLKNKTVDLQAVVASPDAKWLELLACTKGTREYESILTVTARPTHIHLALLMIGLEPGAPMQWLNQGENNPIKILPPSGMKVKVTLIYEKDGKPVEVGPSQWVLDTPTQKTLPDDIWLFAGSRLGTEGKEKLYYADASGAVITLVNFGDDLLTRPNAHSSKDGNDHFSVNPGAIPPKDTKVTIRLQAAK